MADTTSKEKAKEPKKETIAIPTQKVFTFERGTSDQRIDDTVNKWMEEITRAGRPPMLGKCFSNHATGQTVYVYMYTVIKDK